MKLSDPRTTCNLGSKEKDVCPYLIMIKQNQLAKPTYRCGKENPLYKSEVNARIITHRLKRSHTPDCVCE